MFGRTRLKKRQPRRTAMVIVTDTNKDLLHRLELASLFILFCTVWCAGFFGSTRLCETTWCNFLSFCVVSSNLVFVFLILFLFAYHFGAHNKLWNKHVERSKTLYFAVFLWLGTGLATCAWRTSPRPAALGRCKGWDLPSGLGASLERRRLEQV